MIREKFVPMSGKEALCVLSAATFSPKVDTDMWARRHNQHMELFSPGGVEPHSHSNAATVMALARTFFSQHPELVEPHCSLYMGVYEYEYTRVDKCGVDTVVLYLSHTETLAAFSDNPAALHYLVRTHRGLTVQRKNASPEIEVILSITDSEWSLLDCVGITPEDAYGVMRGKMLCDTAIELPEDFIV